MNVTSTLAEPLPSAARLAADVGCDGGALASMRYFLPMAFAEAAARPANDGGDAVTTPPALGMSRSTLSLGTYRDASV